MSTKRNAEHADIYERITNQIIDALENCKSWQRPWHSPEMGSVIPKNAKSGVPYRGVMLQL